MFSTAATYSYVTVNAYNLWALFPLNGESTASNGLWVPDAPIPDATVVGAIGPFPAARSSAGCCSGCCCSWSCRRSSPASRTG